MDIQDFFNKLIRMIVSLLVGVGLVSGPSGAPSPVPQTAVSTRNPAPKSTILPNPAPTAYPTFTLPAPTPTITPTQAPPSMRPQPGSICDYNPKVQALINDLDQDAWVNWIELLSGEKPVQINGETYSILTRYSESMFSGEPNARAYEFVLEQLRQWGYQDNLVLFEQEYQPWGSESTSTWKNIIVLIPGKDPALSQQQVLLTAHLDSTSQGSPEARAPGADDNGSGVATLLEAARVLRGFDFKHTIKIVFFTGEEQGLIGSGFYVSDYQHEMEDILGVFNLDMFGYDSDNDRCFEIHVGRLPESNLVGGCLADIVEEYALDLKYDYLVESAIAASDHASFWDQGVGAIEVLENFNTDELTGGCDERDFNPHYHTEQDLIEHMNLDTGHAIARAAIAALARLAEPIGD